MTARTAMPSWIWTLVLLIATPWASAGDPASLQPLGDAMLQRLEALAELDAPGKAEKKEAKGLGKAIDKLGDYTGLDDKADLKTLAKVASAAFKAKSADEGVLAGITVLRDLIDGIAQLSRQDALNAAAVLVSEKSVAAIDKSVAKGDKKRGDGLVAWPTNHGKGAKKLNAATLTFRKALAKAGKKALGEAKKAPNDARVTDVVVTTLDPQIYHQLNVLADVELEHPVAELTLALRAALKADVDDTGLLDEIAQLTIGETTFLDLPAGTTEVELDYLMPIVRDESFTKLTPEAPDANRQFGRTLALEDTTMVVGAYGTSAGSAFVLERDQDGLGNWGVAAELVFSDFDPQAPNSDDDFGYAVDISGDTIVVGARRHDVAAPLGTIEDAGAAYVFERDAGGPDAWGQVARLVADLPDYENCPSTGEHAEFGRSVAVHGDTIVVGAPGAYWCDGQNKIEAGEAYVYERDAGGPGAWGQAARLRAKFSDSYQRYGQAVEVHGDNIAVGAVGGVGGSPFVGTVSWYERNPEPLGWEQSFVTRVDAGANGGAGYGFGASLCITEDTLVVGAPRTNLNGGRDDAGAVYVFDTTTLSEDCEFFADCSSLAELRADDAASDDFFGNDVSVSTTPAGRQLVVVGAPRGDYAGVQDAGAAYVFDRDLGGPDAYGQLLKVITNGEDAEFTTEHLDPYGSPDPGDPYAVFGPNTFGAAVALDGAQLAIGAPLANQPEISDSGTAWVFAGIEPILSGDYYMAIEVDPHDRLIETANDAAEDNVFPQPSGLVVTFADDELNTPNITLLSAELVPDPPEPPGEQDDGPVILWDVTEGQQSAILGLNVNVLVTGKHDAPLEGVRCRVRAKIADQTGFVTGTIWDEELGDYFSTYELPPLFSDQPVGLHFDVRLPPPPGGLLPKPDGSGYPATVQITLDPFSVIDEYDPDDPESTAEADNSLLVETENFQVLVLPDCTFSETYDKSLGNSDIGASISFDASLDLTRQLALNPVHTLFPASEAEAGAVAGVTGDVDLTIMGNEVELVRFRSLAERDPIQHYAFFGADLLVLNPITDDFQVIYSVGPYDTNDLEDPNLTLPDGFEVCDGDGCEGGIKYTKEFSKSINTNDPKGKKRSKTFYPGGVPVTVLGIVEGKLGFELEAIAADVFSVQGKPFADVSASIGLAIGDCDILCIGAGGEISLVKDEFKAKAALGMQVLEGELDNEPYQNIAASMCFRVANELTMLDGKLYVFAKYPWLKWCSTFLGSIPCGFEIKTSTYDIIDWNAFEFCNVIYFKQKDLCCEPVVGTNPSCVTPDASLCGSATNCKE